MASFFKGPPPTASLAASSSNPSASKSTDALADAFSPRTKNYRQRHAHDRRRSSVGDIPTILTPYQRKEMARQARLEEERVKKELEQKKAEEKRARMRALKGKMKRNDTKNRTERSAHKKYFVDENSGKFVCAFSGKKLDSLAQVEQEFVSHPTMIRGKIWLGNGVNACDIDVIKSLGVTHILNCTKEVALPKNVSKCLKNFKRLPLIDKNSEDLMGHLVSGLYFIDDALRENEGKNDNVVLIHCKQGISRSVSLTCSYLMWKEGIKFETALNDVKSKRHIAQPNDKFTKQLKEFENVLEQLKQKRSRAKKPKRSRAKSVKKPKKSPKNGDVEELEQKTNDLGELEELEEDIIRKASNFKLEKYSLERFEEASRKYQELMASHPNVEKNVQKVRSNSLDRASVVMAHAAIESAELIEMEAEEGEDLEEDDVEQMSDVSALNSVANSVGNTPYESENEKEMELGDLGDVRNEKKNNNNIEKSPKNGFKGKKTFKLGSNEAAAGIGAKGRKSPKPGKSPKNGKSPKPGKSPKSVKNDEITLKIDKNDKNESKDKKKSPAAADGANGAKGSLKKKTKQKQGTKSKGSKKKSSNSKKKKSSKKNKTNKIEKKDVEKFERHRRSSASAIETPRTMGREFDLEFTIDRDLQNLPMKKEASTKGK